MRNHLCPVLGEMQKADLVAFLAWLKKDKDYELCRKSFREYRFIRDDPGKLAEEFLAKTGPRPASADSESEQPSVHP